MCHRSLGTRQAQIKPLLISPLPSSCRGLIISSFSSLFIPRLFVVEGMGVGEYGGGGGGWNLVPIVSWNGTVKRECDRDLNKKHLTVLPFTQSRYRTYNEGIF